MEFIQAFWDEAFINLVFMLIEQNINNPNFGLNDVKNFINSNESRLRSEYNLVIESVGSWFVRYCSCLISIVFD